MLPNTDDNSFSQPLTSLQHIFVISSDPTLISKQIFISSIPSYANCVVTHFMGFVKLIYVHRRTTGENGRERETEGKRERKKRERESETEKNKLKSIFKLNYTHSVSCNVIFPFDSTKKICLSWLLFWYRKYMVHDCFVGFLLCMAMVMELQMHVMQFETIWNPNNIVFQHHRIVTQHENCCASCSDCNISNRASYFRSI